MGSSNYANYFTTSISRDTSVYFPVSRDWNYSDRNANIVSTAPAATDPAPADTGSTAGADASTPAPATETTPAPAETTVPTTSNSDLNAAQQSEIARWESLGLVYGVDFTVNQNGNATFF